MAPRPSERRKADERELTGDFETFFKVEYPRVCRAMFLLGADAQEAEDLAQEAMARVCERWARVARMDSPNGYLWRVALNLNSNRRRRSLFRWRAPADRQLPARDPSTSAAIRLDVRDALGQLAPAHREVLILIDWLGQDTAYVAALLGIEQASVRSRLHRARGRMRGLLEDRV